MLEPSRGIQVFSAEAPPSVTIGVIGLLGKPNPSELTPRVFSPSFEPDLTTGLNLRQDQPRTISKISGRPVAPRPARATFPEAPASLPPTSLGSLESGPSRKIPGLSCMLDHPLR